MEVFSTHGGYLISSGIVLVLTFIAGVLFKRGYNRFIMNSSTRISEDPTKYRFIGHIGVAIIYLVGIGIAISMIPGLRSLAQSLLAGAGIAAVIIGFASKDAFSNIVSGFFIIVFRPFKINDRLKVKEFSGVVEDITLRHTVIRNSTNERIVVPNTIMGNEFLVNSDLKDTRNCRLLDFGIDYKSSVELARKIIREEAEKHPLRIDPRNSSQKEAGSEEIPIRVIGLGDHAIKLRAWVWAANTPDGFVLYCDLLESIMKRFEAEGVEMPYPHLMVINKKLDENTSDTPSGQMD